MTKKEWSSLKIGQRVKKDSWEIDRTQYPPKPKDVTYFGTIIKMNSNYSQALVKYDSGSEIWTGRLGIEIE